MFHVTQNCQTIPFIEVNSGDKQRHDTFRELTPEHFQAAFSRRAIVTDNQLIHGCSKSEHKIATRLIKIVLVLNSLIT